MISQYDLRSLQHERRMLDVYRSRSTREPGFCNHWQMRVARFGLEWQLYEDSAAIRSLWERRARSLAEGFVRKRIRPDQAPEQLLLAMHLAMASRSFELVRRLTQLTLNRNGPNRVDLVFF